MKNETHNMDCMDFMAGLSDKAFDLAIVDNILINVCYTNIWENNYYENIERIATRESGRISRLC